MNVCKHCAKPLVGTELLHVMDGYLYCSKACAIMDAMNNIVNGAMDAATQHYDDCAEVVNTADILKEDMCQYDVTVKYTKRITLHAGMDNASIVRELEKHLRNGELNIDEVSWDTISFDAKLVDDKNSFGEETV